MAAPSTAISVNKVSKVFKVPHERFSSLKQNAIHLFSQKSYSKFEAVKDIEFEVNTGEFFGIVGRNGSGKSTLLKMLAGIYVPSSGKINIDGTLSPFIELGVGFNPELTARENVFLNGAILGLTRKEIEARFDEIINFAELKDFVDQKLKNYSSGMQVRLAFSIAIQAKSDILLIDEVLAVGDAAFQQKCFDVFANLKKEGKTIVFVTHDMGSVMQFCDRAMLIEKGALIEIGKPATIAEKYLLANYRAGKNQTALKSKLAPGIPQLLGVEISDSNGQPKNYFNKDQEIRIQLKFSNQQMDPIHFGVQIFNSNDIYCFGTNTNIDGIPPTNESSGSIDIIIKPPLLGGNYYVNGAVMNDNATSTHDYKPRAATFRIPQQSKVEGIVNVPYRWNNHV